MIQIYSNFKKNEFAICECGDMIFRYETVKGILYPILYKEYENMLKDNYEDELKEMMATWIDNDTYEV